MKVFAYLVVALCVASTLAVVDLDSSLDSIDRPNEDLIGKKHGQFPLLASHTRAAELCERLATPPSRLNHVLLIIMHLVLTL